MVLTPLDFYYLAKELKKIEYGILKRVYKSEDYVFEVKLKKEKVYLVVGKNFCYLDSQKPEEIETKGFVKYLSTKLKNKRLLKTEQNDFNRILVLKFQVYNLILEFIGKGNIILTDKENKIVSCLIQREFKDRKVLVGEEYKFPPSIEIEKHLKTKDENLLNKLHLGETYKNEILKGKNLDKLLNQKITPRVYLKKGCKFFVSPIELKTLKNLKFERKESFSAAIKELFSEKKKPKVEVIKDFQKANLEKYKIEERKFKKLANLVLKYKNGIEKSIEKFKREKEILEPIKEVSKKGDIILEIEGENIKLDINKELKKQIDNFFGKSKKMREKSKKIEKLLAEKIILKEKSIKKEKVKKEWYEQFRYFYTSDNFLVVAGKDADTNEKLIKKYCKKNDIVLHAYIPGSPFGIIRSEGREITQQAIKESAQFVGCYSRFWVSKLGVADVYWVKPDQITKQAKGYLKKGSFMIYGKRNFLRVELKLVIGVNEKFEVIKYPENSAKKPAKYSIILVPGELEGKRLVEEITSKLVEKAKKEDNEKILKINPDEFLKIVPFGKGKVI